VLPPPALQSGDSLLGHGPADLALGSVAALLTSGARSCYPSASRSPSAHPSQRTWLFHYGVSVLQGWPYAARHRYQQPFKQLPGWQNRPLHKSRATPTGAGYTNLISALTPQKRRRCPRKLSGRKPPPELPGAGRALAVPRGTAGALPVWGRRARLSPGCPATAPSPPERASGTRLCLTWHRGTSILKS